MLRTTLLMEENEKKKNSIKEGRIVGSILLKVSYNPKRKLPRDQVNLLYQLSPLGSPSNIYSKKTSKSIDSSIYWNQSTAPQSLYNSQITPLRKRKLNKNIGRFTYTQ